MTNNFNEKEIFNAACRDDFYTFVQKSFIITDSSQKFIPNWHIELICDKLQQCLKGNIKRLIINIPPRNLKSHCASICLPAFILGHKPSSRIVCVSYSQDLANILSRQTKKLMNCDFYKNIFSTKLGSKQTESEFDTMKNGFRYATSIGATLTGIGGGYIIIDDPIKADDANSETIRNGVNEWYNNTLISRLDNKQAGVIILIMQRLHLDDLTGHLLKQDGWELLSLPAIAEKDENFSLSDNKIVGRKKGTALNPKLEPVEILENQKKIMSTYNFSAQYQQRPIPEQGNILDFDLFKFARVLPPSGRVVQSWDIALKDGVNNDYSACVTAAIANGKYYILDVYRDRLDITELINKIKELKTQFQANDVIIEESSVTTHLLQILEKTDIYPIKYRPDCDKKIRANNASLPLKAGKVHLPQGGASWLEDFKTEIISFPKGRFDDQVDAFTQLIMVVDNNDLSSPGAVFEIEDMCNPSIEGATELFGDSLFDWLLDDYTGTMLDNNTKNEDDDSDGNDSLS